MDKESQNRLEHFAALKSKYQATQYEDSLPASVLYLILRKLDLGIELLDLESNWLGESQLEETLEAIKQEQKHKVQEFGNLEFEFSKLKSKYKATSYKGSWQSSHLYFILLKLESGNFLTDLEVKWLRANGLYETNKIALAYYRLEAEFYEQEFHRTGNKWDIPTASSYWRKADEPEHALKLTNLDLNQIKENKLKSAISVTRSAAFRDMDNLADAEICAKKAMEYQPESYQSCTLMAAIAHDRSNYPKASYWFNEAIKRGAKPEDIDDERKRLVRSTKDENKRHEAAEYLLKKDSQRYAWAKSYLKKSSDNGK
ncbi:hypothetical protein [Nostoc sp.]